MVLGYQQQCETIYSRLNSSLYFGNKVGLDHTFFKTVNRYTKIPVMVLLKSFAFEFMTESFKSKLFLFNYKNIIIKN